jgi:hypothetical protein
MSVENDDCSIDRLPSLLQYGSVSDEKRTLKCQKPYFSVGLRTLIEKSLNCIP